MALYRHGQGANKSWRFALHDLRVRGARPCVRYRTPHRGPAARQRSIGSHYTLGLALYRNSRLHTHSSTHSFFEAAGVPKASRGTYTHARCLVQSWASMPRLHQLQASKNHAALPSASLRDVVGIVLVIQIESVLVKVLAVAAVLALPVILLVLDA